MKKIARGISNNSILILIIGFILLIISAIGYMNTKINYDILVYLPDKLETLQGEKILTNDFGIGSYAFVIVENKTSREILELENKIKKIKNTNGVVSLVDVLDTTIPTNMLPGKIKNKLYKDNTTIIMVTFKNSTSSDETIEAFKKLQKTVDKNCKIDSMTAMVLDTMNLSLNEMATYIAIAVIFSLIVLIFTTDSYIIPVLLILNIGTAIIYNMGSNYIFGSISYITQAIAAILQLGVTADFSIFLYHKYIESKELYKNNKEAMTNAIVETFKSILGSSLTTFAGFLALCTMQLTLGKDIGLVLAKGVAFGLLSAITIFPSLLLILDKQITKTKHKIFMPTFEKVQSFTVNHNKLFVLILLILIIPAIIGNSNYKVYYKLDDSLPDTLPFKVAQKELTEKFNIVSPELILIDEKIPRNTILELKEELNKVDGINMVLAPSTLTDKSMEIMLPENIKRLIRSEKYQLIITNSKYELASSKLNNQLTQINKIVKSYDKNAIVAGKGALMKDLVTVADHDFKSVTYTSILAVFIILIFISKSLILPIILTLTIEFAIFVNMSFAFYLGTSLPFIASIVVGTIQLGATIDYAILMSTKYIEERQSEKDKKIAMKNTLAFVMPSVITSALCFFAATSSVGLYTQIDMIGAICILLARGSIISMFVVLFILPSLLMIFDKIIFKTTKIKKVVKNMRKKLIAIMSIALILISPLSVLAKKTETVYTNLDKTGKVVESVVNNHLFELEKGNVSDETLLKEILNINGTEEFTQSTPKLTWKSTGKDIIYQGKIEKELPISVKVKYYLNDEEKSVKDIIGKEGHITVKYSFTNNVLNENNLYTPFVVTMATLISNDNNTNVEVSTGKQVDTGTKKIIAAIATPGMYDNIPIEDFKQLEDIVINYDTTNFSLNDVYLVATPKLLEDVDLKVFDKLDSIKYTLNNLKSKITTLENAANDLEDGINTFKYGANIVSSNIKTTINDVKKLANDSNLNKNINKLTNDLKNLKENLENKDINGSIEQINNLKEKNNEMIAKLQEQIRNNEELYKEYNMINYSISELREYLTRLGMDAKEIENLINVKNIYENSESLIEILNENNNLLDKLKDSTEMIYNNVNDMLEIANEINNKYLSNNQKAQEALNKAENLTNNLHNGTNNIYSGVDKIKNDINLLYSTYQSIDFNQIKSLSKTGDKLLSYAETTKKLVILAKDYKGYASNDAEESLFIYKIES